MSDDSSKVAKVAPLGGARAAGLSLLATAGIYALAPVIAGTALFTALGAGGQTFEQIKHTVANSISAQFVYMVIAQAVTIAFIIGLLKLFRWNWQTIGLTKPRWFHPLVGLAAVVPYFALYVLMAQVVSMLVPGFDISQSQEIGFNNPTGSGQLAMTFISLVMLPPLVEEITMRGFLYTGLRKWLPRIAAALTVSVLFGAAHLSEGGAAGPLWVGALDTAILSMVLIGLREWTGNLWAGIVLHMTKNFIAFLALFIFHVS